MSSRNNSATKRSIYVIDEADESDPIEDGDSDTEGYPEEERLTVSPQLHDIHSWKGSLSPDWPSMSPTAGGAPAIADEPLGQSSSSSSAPAATLVEYVGDQNLLAAAERAIANRLAASRNVRGRGSLGVPHLYRGTASDASRAGVDRQLGGGAAGASGLTSPRAGGLHVRRGGASVSARRDPPLARISEESAAAAASSASGSSGPHRAARSRNVCATIFIGGDGKPTISDVRDRLCPEAGVRGGVCQIEETKDGRLHYQLFFQCEEHITFTAAQKLLAPWKPHIEFARGSVASNVKYCSKDESRKEGPWTWGELKEQGKKGMSRPDALDVMRKFVEAGGSLRDARQHPDLINLFYSNATHTTQVFCDMVAEQHKPPALPELRAWQAKLHAMLQMPPSKRTVYWFYDKIGNCGKSSFAVHMVAKYGEKVFLTDGAGALGDLKLAWQDANRDARVEMVFVDMSRVQEGHTGAIYRFIESVKNNWCANTKYRSGTFWTGTVHVVCFANSPPVVENLSEDRWCIYEIVQHGADWECKLQPALAFMKAAQDAFNL